MWVGNSEVVYGGHEWFGGAVTSGKWRCGDDDMVGILMGCGDSHQVVVCKLLGLGGRGLGRAWYLLVAWAEVRCDAVR